MSSNMASWNPSPTIGGASWQGNPPIVTKNQLLSTSAGLANEILNYSTISLSTLTVPDWISTTILYVSDIQGAKIDISGLLIDASGVFFANSISSQTGSFTTVNNVSTFQLVFAPKFEGGFDFNVSFNLGLGEAIGGLLAGLGAAVGGAFIGVGTGLGLAIQGAEQGIGTIIAGRPQNFINQNTYETINFTSQLQISTLGNDSPVYSSIFRTVSSVAADSVPGREIFTSSFFYPGQICVRTVSDPFNLVTGDPNLNTSTIQSFGQWVPLTGLEPDNIVANSVSTNYLNAGFADITVASISSLGVASNISMNYDADILFNTGATNFARLLGTLQNFYLQTDNRFIFTQPFTTTENASLDIGSNANESFLTVSSIYSQGNIQANTGYFSTLIANDLIVVSTFSTIYNVVASNVLSTNTITANLVSTTNLEAQYIAPFTFSSILGNPSGPFDITRVDSVVSTTYNGISSLQQNILNYSLNSLIQDQASFNLPLSYNVLPSGVQQWASTVLIRGDTGRNAATLGLSYYQNWLAGPVTSGTFDLVVDQRVQPFNFFVYEASNSQNTERSTIFTIPPTPNFYQTYRFTLQPTGWWNYVTPAPPPYSTSNNNTLQIYQDINDTYIQGTDRLHIVAGDILLDGTTSFQNMNIDTLNAINLNGCNSYMNSTFTNFLTTSSITANPLTGGIDAYYYKSTLGFNAYPTQTNPLTLTFRNDPTDFIPTYNIVAPFIGNNYFTSYNVNSWNNTRWNNNVAFSLGVPRIWVGDLQQSLGPYSAFFYLYNLPNTPAYPLPIIQITSAGSNLAGAIPGGKIGLISTSNGVNWTVSTLGIDPYGTQGGSYCNIVDVTQTTTQTTITNTQNLLVTAPNTFLQTGSMFMYADQIRVNSHQYGTTAYNGIPSFPIGIENNVYIDPNISWTQNPPASGIWQSDATNAFSNITGSIYYDYNSWIVQVIPSRFRTNTYPIYSWDVQPTIINVGGTGAYAWGFNRYIQIAAGPSGPGVNTTNNWNWYIAFPKNYCTYTA